MRVGFIGLGAMGAGLAANLIRANTLSVTVCDVRQEAVDKATALGALSAKTPAEAAKGSDIVGICVRDDSIVELVTEGPGGIVETLQPGTIVLIHSTVRPETIRRAHAVCREKGATLLDVDMSGFPDKAASGDLTLFIGGDESAIPTIEPYLSAIGTQWFHMGPVGSGAVAKHVNNVMYLINARAMREALNLAQVNGLNMETMVKAARVSSGDSEALRRWTGATSAPAISTTAGGTKILRDSLAMARANGLEMPVTAAVIDLIDSEAAPPGR